MVTDNVFDFEHYDESHEEYKDADTRLWDENHEYHYAYRCSNLTCPHIVKDYVGDWACYGSRYKKCKSKKCDVEEIKEAIKEVRVAIGTASYICKDNGRDDIAELLEDMNKCLRLAARPFYGVTLRKKNK